MNMDAPPFDPKCAASLLMVGKSGELTCEPYPHMGGKEPPAVAIDDAAAAAMKLSGSHNEVTDPQDYVPEAKQHNILVQPRCYYSTDESADREKEVLDVIKNAKLELFDLERNRHIVGGDWDEHKRKLCDAQQRLSAAEPKLVPQSAELLPDKVKAFFNCATMTWTIEATYTNPTQKPISATVALDRTEALRLVSTEVEQFGYKGTTTFKPNKEAKQAFDEACASKTSGASLQTVDRKAYTQTANVPAFTPWLGSSRRRAQFTAIWVLACEDVEGKAHLLPHEAGRPRQLAYDFAIQPPAQLGSNPIPFTLEISEPEGTMRLDEPSRAAAALDARPLVMLRTRLAGLIATAGRSVAVGVQPAQCGRTRC